MSEQEQINELCKFCCYPCEMCDCGGECLDGNDPTTCSISRDVAEAIYSAGYRKEGDSK